MKKITTTLFICVACINVSIAQIFHENFENPDSVTYWSNSSASWGQNSRLSTSGMYSDSASIQNVGDTIIMTTIPFSTLGHDSVFLYFNHICKIEFFDAGIIEVSVDGGITWIKLIDSYGNPGGQNNCTYYGLSLFRSQGSKFQEASYASWYPGSAASTPELTWFHREIFDVSDLLANVPVVQIRFVLIDQNLNGGNGRAGWFIDDILVNDSLNTYLYTFQNVVTGKFFVDLNSNLIQDAGEPPVKYRTISELAFPYHAYTNSNGYYFLKTFTVGNVDLQPDSFFVTHPYFTLVPNIQTSTFTSVGQMDSLKDFALQPTILVNDLSVWVSRMNDCRNIVSKTYYMIWIHNAGSTVLSPDVMFYPNSLLTYDSSSIVPSFVSIDSIGWSLGPLYPFQSEWIKVYMQKPLGIPIGTQITSYVKVEPIIGDINDTNNFAYDTTLICASYDPNLITVNHSTLTTTDISASPFLEYIIYFQNTGNDTARYVRIDNLIPTKLNLNTFEILAHSHDMEIEYNYLVNPRLISFTHNNIYLPDSATNEPESHGFVRYRIKPLSTLVVGDSILNRADIYFDFNPPVGTNTAVTEIVDPTSITEFPTDVDKLIVFPNPFNESVAIKFYLQQSTDVIVEIFNLYGQRIKILPVEKMNAGNNQITISLQDVADGIYFVQVTKNGSRHIEKIIKMGR